MARSPRSKKMPVRGGRAPVQVQAIHLLILLGLLVAPVLALRKLAAVVDPWLVCGAPGVVSIVTYTLYAVDKRRAEAGAWRTPESVLHSFELLGGWPGAWIAQRRLRHKTRKLSFQIVYWLIVLAHQVAAIGYVRDWNWQL